INPAIAARRGLAARIDELERAGYLVTLGTDNMAEDMMEVVRTAMFMERVRRADGRQPTPEQALTWATRNGYRPRGIPDGGWLAPGNRADFIVVDFRRPHLTPALRPVSCFVHQGQAGDVESVMVDGRWLMRDRRVLTLDEPAIVAEAERVARSAWTRLFAERPDLKAPPGLDLSPREFTNTNDACAARVPPRPVRIRDRIPRRLSRNRGSAGAWRDRLAGGGLLRLPGH